MRLELTNRQALTTHRQLDGTCLAQLRVCGIRYDGRDLPPERRLYDPYEDCETPEEEEAIPIDDDNFFGFSISRSRIRVDGVHRYDLWLYKVDSGTMFEAGTDTVVATIIQFDAQPENGDRTLVEPLDCLLRELR